MRNCTEEDFAKFHPPRKSSEKRIENLEKSSGLYCINFQDIETDLYSSWIYSENYSAIDILAVPCGTVFDGDDTPIRDDCEWNRTAALEYLGTVKLVVIFN